MILSLPLSTAVLRPFSGKTRTRFRANEIATIEGSMPQMWSQSYWQKGGLDPAIAAVRSVTKRKRARN